MSEQFNQFIALLTNTLSSFSSNCDIFLLGDFYIDAIKYDSASQGSTDIDKLFDLTRCTDNSATFIFKALTNVVQTENATAMWTRRISNHFTLNKFWNLFMEK